MDKDPQRPFVKNVPIPDGEPEDPPLTADEASKASPANREAYDDAERSERQTEHLGPEDADPAPRG